MAMALIQDGRGLFAVQVIQTDLCCSDIEAMEKAEELGFVHPELQAAKDKMRAEAAKNMTKMGKGKLIEMLLDANAKARELEAKLTVPSPDYDNGEVDRFAAVVSVKAIHHNWMDGDKNKESNCPAENAIRIDLLPLNGHREPIFIDAGKIRQGQKGAWFAVPSDKVGDGDDAKYFDQIRGKGVNDIATRYEVAKELGLKPQTRESKNGNGATPPTGDVPFLPKDDKAESLSAAVGGGDEA
jgi:hypothetical protein